jgi:hypothetical protein
LNAKLEIAALLIRTHSRETQSERIASHNQLCKYNFPSRDTIEHCVLCKTLSLPHQQFICVPPPPPPPLPYCLIKIFYFIIPSSLAHKKQSKAGDDD